MRIQTQGYARAIDISYGLSVTKPSVSVAMRNLREYGYITGFSGSSEIPSRYLLIRICIRRNQ